MRFLDTNQIEQLEQDVELKELPLTAENLDKELERLNAIKTKLCSYDLASELESISEARYLAPQGASNIFEKIRVSIASKKRYKLALKRYARAKDLSVEVNARIEDIEIMKNYCSAWPEYSHYADKKTETKKVNENQTEEVQRGE